MQTAGASRRRGEYLDPTAAAANDAAAAIQVTLKPIHSTQQPRAPCVTTVRRAPTVTKFKATEQNNSNSNLLRFCFQHDYDCDCV